MTEFSTLTFVILMFSVKIVKLEKIRKLCESEKKIKESKKREKFGVALKLN